MGADQCHLVQADLLHLPDELLRGAFDVAFSSGVLSWIGDLERWFAAVHRALKPNGVLVVGGVHPLALYFGERARGATDWRSYFDEGPFTVQPGSSHRWNPAGEAVTTVQWMHTLGHVISSIAQAGFRVSHLLELPDQAEVYGVSGGPGEFLLRAPKA